MIREPGTVRSRDLSSSRRTTETGHYCENDGGRDDDDDDDHDDDDDALVGEQIFSTTTPGNLSNRSKCVRRNVDSFLSDGTACIPTRPVPLFSPPSPSLSAETQNVIDNVEKMLHEARQQIMEFSRKPSTLNNIPTEYPSVPLIDNENDQLLYIRELVTSRLNELDMGFYKPSLQRPRPPRDVSRILPRVDLSAPKFQPRNYRHFSHRYSRYDAQRSALPNRVPTTKPPSLISKSKPILEKTRAFSVQACPKVNIDPELSAHKMENVDISPDPSFVGTINNTGKYEYRHGFENEERRRKVCRMGNSTTAVGIKEGCSSTAPRDTDVGTTVRPMTVAGTSQVTNGEQKGAASNLVSESITSSSNDGGEERISEESEEQREAPTINEGPNDEGGAAGEREVKRPFLLRESAEMRPNDKDNYKASSEVCVRCLAKSDNECKMASLLDFTSEEGNIEREVERQINRHQRDQIDRDFRDILNKYDPRYKADPPTFLEESLNVDSMTNSQILEYDLSDINLTKPPDKHFKAIISIYDETIDKIVRDSGEIARQLSQCLKSYSSGSDEEKSLRTLVQSHSTKQTLPDLQSKQKLITEVPARDNNIDDCRESVRKLSEFSIHPQKVAEYNFVLCNVNNIPNTEVPRIMALNMASKLIDYVPPIAKDSENGRQTSAKESLAKREYSRGNGEGVSATGNVPANQRWDASAPFRFECSDNSSTFVRTGETSGQKSSGQKSSGQTSSGQESSGHVSSGLANTFSPLTLSTENVNYLSNRPRLRTSLSTQTSASKADVQGRSGSMSDHCVSRNNKSVNSESLHRSRNSRKASRDDKSNAGEPSVPFSSKRAELFSYEIAAMKSSQVLPVESKVSLTEMLSSADSLKDCPSFGTSISCPRGQESLIRETKVTKSIQTDAQPVSVEVKCIGTEGKLVQTDTQPQLAVIESTVSKRAPTSKTDVETSRRSLSVNQEKVNQSKSSRQGSQNSSLEMITSKTTSHLSSHNSYKIREAVSDESRSEGEVYLATSSSYSLGEVRILAKDLFVNDDLVIECDSMIHSKSSTESYGEIRG